MWSAPVIAVGTAAPAEAVSPLPPGLHGWVTVGKNCDTFGNDTLTINGTGGNGAEPPNTGTRGIWIYITTSSTTLANARMTFYYPNSVAPLTWSAASGNSGWSVPVVSTVDPTIAGFTAHTTFYTGGWEFRNLPGTANDYSRARGRPNFQASKVISSCGSAIQIYARRTVTVEETPTAEASPERESSFPATPEPSSATPSKDADDAPTADGDRSDVTVYAQI